MTELIAVTGGAGFLGRRVVELLLEEGYRVRSISRGDYPDLAAMGVECVRADLADPERAASSVAGVDAVVHCAAKAGVWGPRAGFERANVDATRNVIEACLRHGVGRLVHTSSPSVCFDGRDHRSAGDLPLATRFLAAYPETKARAERMVLEANGPDLATVALRPHLIFGPRDPHLVPRLLERAGARRLAIVGDGTNEVSLTHVDNAAGAHVDALRALAPDAPCAGRGYFVANQEPVRLWEWIAEVLERTGRPPIRRRVPLALARTLGAACELLWTVGRLAGEPPMTRFVALQLARSHSYDLSGLREDVGYVERVSLREGTEAMLASLEA